MRREEGRLTVKATGVCSKRVIGALAVLAATSATPVAYADGSCTGQLGLDYVGGPRVAAAGDRVRVRLTLGTGSVGGGTKLSVDGVRFVLGCNAASSKLVSCSPDGGAVGYAGDVSITTTCPVGFTSGHARIDVQ